VFVGIGVWVGVGREALVFVGVCGANITLAGVGDSSTTLVQALNIKSKHSKKDTIILLGTDEKRFVNCLFLIDYFLYIRNHSI
jgi:hypothetical protein